MTQEERQLLFKDLCARLPYKPYLEWDDDKVIELNPISYETIARIYFQSEDNIIRPYLRPMSSMTEEENSILTNISNKDKGFEEDENGWIRCDSIHTKWGVYPYGCAKLLDYLNSIHVDYRGLIPMGLAIEAPEGMYNNTKTE